MCPLLLDNHVNADLPPNNAAVQSTTPSTHGQSHQVRISRAGIRTLITKGRKQSPQRGRHSKSTPRHEPQRRFVPFFSRQHSIIVQEAVDVMCACRQVSGSQMPIVVLLPSQPMDSSFDVDDLDAILLQDLDVVTLRAPDTQFVFLRMYKLDLAPVTPGQ